MKGAKVALAGKAALDASAAGAPLYVRSFGGLVPALPGTLERARRMSPHATWIYVTLRGGRS